MTTVAIAPPLSPLTTDTTVSTGGDPASTLAGTVAARMGLLVAPAVGRFRALVAGGRVEPGTVIGVVTGGGGRADEVRVPVAAVICGLLVLEGQLVQSGQALAWIRRLDA